MDLTKKYMIKESKGKEFPENIIKQMQKMTDQNDHNSARALAAKTIKDKKMAEAYKGIEKVVEYLGHIPHELSMLRSEIDKRLFHTLKTKYSNGQDAYMAM